MTDRAARPDPRRIVVGLPPTDAGSAALAWAARLAASTEVELIGISALEQDVPLSARRVGEVTARRNAELDSWITPGQLSGAPLTIELEFGDPRVVLSATAKDHRVEALVVGRQGPGSRPGVLHLGSVAEYLAHHVSIPLAVIPSGTASDVRRMVVGVDGSEASRAAVSWCARLAGLTGASVVAVQVHEPFLEWTPETDLPAWHAAAEQSIREDLAAELVTAGVELSPVAVRGVRPADGLLRVVDGHGADLLVVGMRGLGGFSGLRIGGVAIDVLHRSEVAVALIPGASADAG